MKCPYCGKQANVEHYVYHNLESYGGNAKARTSCCNKIIRVIPKITFSAVECDPKYTVDDWGK